jgi:hypothetical protein
MERGSLNGSIIALDHSPDAALPISGRCGIPDHGTFVERKVLSRNGQALSRENGMAPTALLAVGWRCTELKVTLEYFR